MRDCFPATSKRVKCLVRELLPQLTHLFEVVLSRLGLRLFCVGRGGAGGPRQESVGKDALLGAMAEAERGGLDVSNARVSDICLMLA